MTEKMHVRLRTQEEYNILLEQRLPQLALVRAARYLLMFKVDGGSAAAASTVVEFSQLISAGPKGAQSDTYLHETTFTDDDFRPLFKIAGVIRDDFVTLDNPLQFGAPHTGSMRKAYVLSEGFDPDNGLSLEAERFFESEAQLSLQH
jgi:hypothetical protein